MGKPTAYPSATAAQLTLNTKLYTQELDPSVPLGNWQFSFGQLLIWLQNQGIAGEKLWHYGQYEGLTGSTIQFGAADPDMPTDKEEYRIFLDGSNVPPSDFSVDPTNKRIVLGFDADGSDLDVYYTHPA